MSTSMVSGVPVAEDQQSKVYRPGITVLIAAHPARFLTGMVNEAFASVTKQTLQADTIVVVNDLERAGAGRTRQKLLRAVETEWTAWLDSDDTMYPNHLEDLHRVAVETDSVYVYSWFDAPNDPLGHFGLPYNPCTPHHTTITALVRTELLHEVGCPDNEPTGPFANDDWSMITGIAKLACERGLKMTHLAKRTWHWRMQGQNTSGRPGQGDAR